MFMSKVYRICVHYHIYVNYSLELGEHIELFVLCNLVTVNCHAAYLWLMKVPKHCDMIFSKYHTIPPPNRKYMFHTNCTADRDKN